MRIRVPEELVKVPRAFFHAGVAEDSRVKITDEQVFDDHILFLEARK
jgi:hypothetical protein